MVPHRLILTAIGLPLKVPPSVLVHLHFAGTLEPTVNEDLVLQIKRVVLAEIVQFPSGPPRRVFVL